MTTIEYVKMLTMDIQKIQYIAPLIMEINKNGYRKKILAAKKVLMYQQGKNT